MERLSLTREKLLTMRGKRRSVWKEIPALMPENLCGNHKNSAKNENNILEYGRKSINGE